MFQDEVKRISELFISEAKQSPSLLEDMAAMEKYMSESYYNRTFIELLQNADDAFSTKVLVKKDGENIYFANNGNPFSKADLMAICRSGASTKHREKSIGYRGIGFKSTTSISNNILIFSNDTYFSFSKTICAKILNKAESKIPTVRIPILVESKYIEDKIFDNVNSFIADGYSSIFIFQKAKADLFKDELQDITNGLFIFLRNICECNVDFEEIKKKYLVSRLSSPEGKHIILKNEVETEEWLIIDTDKAAVALKMEKGQIIPCSDEEAVYHCYLPTKDRVLYPCKINADFSTDPSRKHIAYDEHSEKAICSAANVLFQVLQKAINECDSEKFRNLLVVLSKSLSFSKVNIELGNKFRDLINSNKWIQLADGNKISAREYKCIPDNYDEVDKIIIRKKSSIVKGQSLPTVVYDNVDRVDDFFRIFSDAYFTNDEIKNIAKESNFVKSINIETQSHIISNIVKESKQVNSLNEDEIGFTKVLLPTESGEELEIEKIVKNNCMLLPQFKNCLLEQLMPSEIEWLKDKTGISDKILSAKESPVFKKTTEKNNIKLVNPASVKPYVSKWRDAEQKCLEIEEILGNKAQDVSIRNEGYDIVSMTPEGTIRYIEVKSVKANWEFSLTNNEYTAASQYGEKYFVLLLSENTGTLQARYIQNPIKTAKFEKRIRQWEWVCLNSNSNELEFNIK